MTITFRPYQLEAATDTNKGWSAGDLAQMIVLPTGCGKTLTGLNIIAPEIERGLRVFWLAHRTELLSQPLRAWRELFGFGTAGIVKADIRDGIDCQLVFASTATLVRAARLRELLDHGHPTVVVWDEAHHTGSEGQRNIRRALDEACSPRHLGLTATPERTDRKALGGEVGFKVAYQYPLPKAVEEGHLVPWVPKVVRLPDLDFGACGGGGEHGFNDARLEDELLKAEVVRHTADAIVEHAPDRKGVVFCVTRRQARETRDELRARGLAAEMVDGDMEDDEREAVLDAHKVGELRWLTNCNVLTEGYDDPSIDCVVVARPTKSKPLYVQQVGRGLRPAPGKADCLILDIAGASEEHELITAAHLVDRDAAQDDARPKTAQTETERRFSLYASLWARRSRRPLQWVDVPNIDRRAFVVTAGDSGDVVIVEAGRKGWNVHLVKRDFNLQPEPKTAEPVDLSIAMALGEEIVRQAGALGLAAADTDWRLRAPSQKQIDLLRRRGVRAPPKTIGEASDLITSTNAAMTLTRHRIARRRSNA